MTSLTDDSEEMNPLKVLLVVFISEPLKERFMACTYFTYLHSCTRDRILFQSALKKDNLF